MHLHVFFVCVCSVVEPQCLKALSISHLMESCHSERVASLTGEAGKMDPFILWELFQCQTPVLSVFSNAESWSVFASEEGN